MACWCVNLNCHLLIRDWVTAACDNPLCFACVLVGVAVVMVAVVVAGERGSYGGVGGNRSGIGGENSVLELLGH